MTTDVSALTTLIDNEVIVAMGLSPERWPGRVLHPLLSRATRRFSAIFAAADQIIARDGISAAARWVLLNLVKDFSARGVQNIPADGPLIIASNHPGAVDSLAISASAHREDLKIIASDVPFLQSLSHIADHLIFLPRKGIQGRMLATRRALRHIEDGGALLLFARGGIDPDPSFMQLAEAEAELNNWSRSLALFLAKVPRTRVITSIVSHVLDPAYMRHPITWLKHKRPDRQRLAMMIQIIQQMLGKRVEIVPHVSFGDVIDWQSTRNATDSLRVIVAAAQRLLISHQAWRA